MQQNATFAAAKVAVFYATTKFLLFFFYFTVIR